jgi:tetratricopeptide (TPR) repeat protein
MFDRTQWVLAGMSLTLSFQLSQAAAAVSIGKALKTAQTNSSEPVVKAFKEGLQLSQQGTADSKKSEIAKYEEALKQYRAMGNRLAEAGTLHNIANIYSELGEQQKALEYYSDSLPLFRAIGDRRAEAFSLRSIGQVYSKLGEKQKALEYYSDSLPLFQAIGDRRGEAGTLNSIGSVYSQLGEPQKALEYYSESLALSRAVGDRFTEY